MWVEKEAPMKDMLVDRGNPVLACCSAGSTGWAWGTYASSTTPIRRLVAVPNRPIDQVAIGDTSRATRASVSRYL